VSDDQIRADLERHWQAAGADDQPGTHDIYHEDCVVEWPQSGERIRGRANLQALRENYPAKLEFSVRRILGGGDLWITEYEISYDGNPVHVVSIMEFREGKVRRETHYFADPFEPPDWRSAWVERM
jgi:SnoaL-like protein